MTQVTATSAATELLTRWHDVSVESVWTQPTDWFDPSVEAVAEALAEGADPCPAVAALGMARGASGVRLNEALDDLSACFRVAGHLAPPYAAVRAFSLAWADAAVMPLRQVGAEDPFTGLPVASYLRTRLAESYRAAQAAGCRPDLGLVVLDCAVLTADPMLRIEAGVVLAEVLQDVFDGGDPMVSLAPGRVAVLLPMHPELNEVLARLRDRVDVTLAQRRLSRLLGRPARLWVERLPDDLGQAQNVVNELGR